MRAMLVVLAVVSLMPRRADACSAPSCRPSFVLPGGGATVPANLPGFWWRQGSNFMGGADAGAVSLVNLDGGATVPLTVVFDGGSYLLVPEQLQAGERYRFGDDFECWSGSGGLTANFLVSGAAPLPTTLGTLQMTSQTIEALTVMTRAGSCSDVITAALRRVMLQPSAEAEPWVDVFFFETLVDDQPWVPTHSLVGPVSPGASWEGRGEDLFYRRCSESTTLWAGLAEGSHQAVLRAWLPGTDVVLTTPPVTFVLSCSGDPGTPDGGLVEVTHAGGELLPRCGCSSGAGALVALMLLALRRRR